MRTLKTFNFLGVLFALLATPLFSYAASAGCGEITEIIPVNKPPMDDVYRLSKVGFTSGGMITQVLSGIPGVGILTAAVADNVIGAIVTDAKLTEANLQLDKEKQAQQWKDIFDVTIKPDFGNPITITIREDEIDRFGLKQGRRAIIYYPKTEPIVVTFEGKYTNRTRPSFSKKIVYGWYDAPDKPVGNSGDDHYNDVCYRGQKVQPFVIASGPWIPIEPLPPMTDYEIREMVDEIFQAGAKVEKKRKELAESNAPQEVLDKVDLEFFKLQLLFAEGLLYDRKISDSAAWRVEKYDKKVNELQIQIEDLQSKMGIEKATKQDPSVVRYRQSIVLRLKAKSDVEAKSSN